MVVVATTEPRAGCFAPCASSYALTIARPRDEYGLSMAKAGPPGPRPAPAPANSLGTPLLHRRESETKARPATPQPRSRLLGLVPSSVLVRSEAWRDGTRRSRRGTSSDRPQARSTDPRREPTRGRCPGAASPGRPWRHEHAARARSTSRRSPRPALPASPGGSSRSGGQSLSLQAALYGGTHQQPRPRRPPQGNVRGMPRRPRPSRSHGGSRPRSTPRSGSMCRPCVYERASRACANPDHKDALYVLLAAPADRARAPDHATATRSPRPRCTQQRWTVVQAELLALVQTYRFFQTAAYRREKLRVAQQLADFNDHLVQIARATARGQSGHGRRSSRSPRWRVGRPASWSRRPSRTTTRP